MRPISVLDFGAQSVMALIARKKKNGQWELLGGGNAKPEGVQHGEITNLGDAVECVTQVLRRAESSSAERIKMLYFSFNHDSVEKIGLCGTKYLTGEGQIQASDIRDAKETALRMGDSFDRSLIYAKETSFLIDEKDTVLNPIGIYGRRLDVFLSAWMVDSTLLDRWVTLMRRAYVKKVFPVLPNHAEVYGTANATHGVSHGTRLPDGQEQVFLLNDPACAGVAGMLEVAAKLEAEKPAYFQGTHLLSNLKEKAASCWNEYF